MFSNGLEPNGPVESNGVEGGSELGDGEATHGSRTIVGICFGLVLQALSGVQARGETDLVRVTK